MNSDYQKAAQIIKAGGIAVIPTDTIYGIVASALNKTAVEKIYSLKGRPPEKPFIILISDLDQLADFEVQDSNVVKDFWPGPVSIILNTNSNKQYLHRGTKSLAFRMPNKPELVEFLKEVGAIVAPSANPSGLSPAKNIAEAQRYFEQKVDYYLDEGTLEGKPSTLIKVTDGKVEYLRK